MKTKKSLMDNEHVQRMLQSQEQMAERDMVWIREKQSEMLKKYQQREAEKAEKKAADAKK